ncbi:MAG: metallophosphoesterase [Lachnospiraceae bacterium]|nr:metallophosphoesterase [Lachnospiraceae bacterium]
MEIEKEQAGEAIKEATTAETPVAEEVVEEAAEEVAPEVTGEVVEEVAEEVVKKKKPGKKKKFWLTILIIFLISLPGYYCGLTVRNYEIKDARIQGKMRIALVTDLHSCKYGKGQKTLLDAIDQQKPDVILLGGDIFDDQLSNVRTEEFLAGISGRYPCYYVTGNHECWAGTAAYLVQMEILEKYGIIRLTGELVELEFGDAKILLGGVDDPQIELVNALDEDGSKLSHSKEMKQLKKSLAKKRKKAEEGADPYAVLLSHRPDLVGEYGESGFDLILAGHAHGGQIRIPGLVNGLFVPDQGLFPKYAGGRYDLDQMTMIISRGLARESTLFPRFCNPPELVIIDLCGE